MALEQNNTALEFETMLRRQLSQKSGAHNSRTEICVGFDADSANAYLENALGSVTRSRYESHLAGCPPCRQHIIQLSQLLQLPQTEPQFVPIVKPASIWSHWKSVAAEWMEWLDTSLGKQGWATAGVAAAILITVTSVQFWRLQQSSQQPQENLAAIVNKPAAQPAQDISGNVSAAPEANNPLASRQLEMIQVPKPEVSPHPGSFNQLGTNSFSDSNFKVNAFTSTVGEGSPASLQLNVTMPPLPPQTQPVASALISSASRSTAFGPTIQPVMTEQAAPAPPPVESQKSESVVAAHITPSPSDNPMAKKSKDPKPQSRSVFDKALSFMPAGKTESGRKLEEKEIEPDAPKVLAVRRRDKVFNYQGGFWVDSAYKPEMAWRVTKLTLDSAEYDQVLSAEPLLNEYFAHGPAIVVWKDKIYKLVSK